MGHFWKSINWPKANTISTWFGIVLFAGYAVTVGFQPKQIAHSQTAYITGTTLAMDQTSCLPSTPSSPFPLIANGTTLACLSAWPSTYAVGAINGRTITAGVAFQATDTTKAATVNINLKSTISQNVAGSATVDAGVYVGGSGVGTSGGTLVCEHINSQTLGLVVAFSLSQTLSTPCTGIVIAAGEYVAVRNITGSVTIVNANDRSEN